ncbi:MAG: putative Na+-dependent transporter [Candidatus Nanohaloarchaea archaeon]|jgi:predicted Na+-dependent transporter
MPFHGLKTDLELALLVVSAGAVSYFISGQVLSNVLFTFLLASLFFLVGLHLDLGFFKAIRNKGSQLSVSLIAIYALVPAIAYIFSFVPGHIGEVFLVLGASGAALSSPKIWSNMAKADGDLASYSGTFSIFASLVFVPVLLLLFPLEIDYTLMMENMVFVVAPFLIGIVTQNYENNLIEDLRIHFSKLAFWLITLITLVQAKLILQADGVIYVSQLLIAALLFAAFSILTFGYSHVLGILSGFYEKESRAIGFISSSRNVAIAFFLAVHVSPEAVMLVGVYYFVRQFMGVLYVDMYLHGEPKFMERIGF